MRQIPTLVLIYFNQTLYVLHFIQYQFFMYFYNCKNIGIQISKQHLGIIPLEA